jgi:RNA polymerase sigma-70 factor (ECF subfamily)
MTASEVYEDVTDVALGRPVRAVPSAAASAAFLELYAETVGPLGGYAYQLVGDRELAADVVQEAYTRLLARWVSVRKPRPYLFHIATNLARDTWQARQRAELTVRAVVDNRPDLVSAASDPSVWDAVARLPKKYREVVLLHYYADLPLAEVAAAVRRPVGTVKRLVSEARDLLAQTLGDAR